MIKIDKIKHGFVVTEDGMQQHFKDIQGVAMHILEKFNTPNVDLMRTIICSKRISAQGPTKSMESLSSYMDFRVYDYE